MCQDYFPCFHCWNKVGSYYSWDDPSHQNPCHPLCGLMFWCLMIHISLLWLHFLVLFWAAMLCLTSVFNTLLSHWSCYNACMWIVFSSTARHCVFCFHELIEGRLGLLVATLAHIWQKGGVMSLFGCVFVGCLSLAIACLCTWCDFVWLSLFDILFVVLSNLPKQVVTNIIWDNMLGC